MRIALDVSIQDTPFLTGVERVQRSILRELASIDRDNEYFLIAKREVHFDFELPDNFRLVDLSPHRPSYLWRETLIPPLISREKIDIFHSPVSAIPVLGRAKKIATLHELPWVERERRHTKVIHGHRAWLFLNTRYAHRLFAVSERTRENILGLYPKAADKVVVIPHGVDPCFRVLPNDVDRSVFLARYGIPDAPFLLYVGTVRRKKNLRALLEAFAALPKSIRERHNLVLTGIRNTAWPELEEVLMREELKDRIYFPGYVGDEDLVTFYNLAMIFVYPSFFEGFGLPPLEAMACGTPVLTSNGGAIPEVVGDAATIVDPTDQGALKAAMINLIEDEKLRKKLVRKGHKRVERFTWRKTAEAILSQYDQLMDCEVDEGS